MMAEDCLHHLESSKPKRRGRWIRPLVCKSTDELKDGKIVPKQEYDQFLSKDEDV